MGKYDDIIDLPHFVSKKYPQMSMRDRAAQFSPFAALTGYDAEIKETARLTDKRIEFDEDVLDRLNERLNILRKCLDDGDVNPDVRITYFEKDLKKDGGKYISNRYYKSLCYISYKKPYVVEPQYNQLLNPDLYQEFFYYTTVRETHSFSIGITLLH